MYIETNKQQYRCTGATLSGDPMRFTLPDGGPESCGDMVGLYQDDGFLLRELDVSGYTRKGMRGSTLVITNQPEPAPTPEPGPDTTPTEFEKLRADVDFLAAMGGIAL
jgi:hypothetical protein